ncbi:elongation factor P--(R)-beta-lysine ligase [Echinimonas agarilytica]|uniref:Elongation factor P--(R)-beta-lysine ligase n=1 Tax=Echinimonas agarilytica TaxID=1215918 RepID=A0AA42B663_9GAMM|nr:elongation factor P--(R)-beta-lysine ligase [Echinimonas agarilytica]MCM2678427.1 elongation factor P--(R)-beta-lysine ligase [Echinimonas agarilytica]
MWQPDANLDMLRARAALLRCIRNFFAERNVLEVETPALSQASVTDPHLHTFQTQFASPESSDEQSLYLMTSPEFHMKRLLCSGSGCIYQIGKAFRNEEQGRFHNPEFTMLEWYRVGFDHHQLMDDMEALLVLILECGQCDRITYQQAFMQTLDVDPLSASLTELAQSAPDSCTDLAAIETDRDTLLQLLFSMGVEPHIGLHSPVFVYDFPASQAALARINQQDKRVADRFEVYFKGIELANGFYELADAAEQLQRFRVDNQTRVGMGLAEAPIDGLFLQALEKGLPDCSGVALGIDRLLMLQQSKQSIAEVMAFSVQRA